MFKNTKEVIILLLIFILGLVYVDTQKTIHIRNCAPLRKASVLRCPHQDVLLVENVWYGRRDNETKKCGKDYSKEDIQNCWMDDVTRHVRKSCDQKPSCKVDLNTKNVSDECPGRYSEIAYICASPAEIAKYVKEKKESGGYHAKKNPIPEKVYIAGLWLAAHKYFEVDRRKVTKISKFQPREFHKHFPRPHLRRLHPKAEAECDKGALPCINLIVKLAKKSYSLSNSKYVSRNTMSAENPKMSSMSAESPKNLSESAPFKTGLELFQFRTTASYFMCLFTMQRHELMQNFYTESSCLQEINIVKEKAKSGVEVKDSRNSKNNPFKCAEIMFCPDPCYGRKSGGSVTTGKDKGNPCRKLKDDECKWNYERNLNFKSLERNRFNISCNCHAERPGFEWNSQFGLCVDIDECYQNASLCAAQGNKVCENLAGTYKCMCARGQRWDSTSGKCEEHVPLPAHLESRPKTIKAKKHKSTLMQHLMILLGLKSRNS